MREELPAGNKGLAARHRAEWLRLNETVAGLEARANEAQNNVDDARQDVHKVLLAGVASVMNRHETDPAYQELTKAYIAEQGGDPSKHQLLLPMVRDAVEEVSLDSFDREQRRGILRLLEVKVPMYPQKSEFARTHEHRWDFKFSDATLLSTVSSWGWRCAPPHASPARGAPRRPRR
jgi:hypothetical protein